jgi:glycerol-3-phosphate O-acyltransferase/dihydroxyacetone phosphate acyltransferase
VRPGTLNGIAAQALRMTRSIEARRRGRGGVHCRLMSPNGGPEQHVAREPRLRDRFLRRLLRFAVFFLYEDVEVLSVHEPGSLRGRPVLAVSSHFGGFADAFLILHASPVVPRIIARDKIWKIPVAGSLMRWIGAIPVHKPEDHKGPTSNRDMFASCYEGLADGDVLLIFPEGVTSEDPSIAPVKSGAARIALGARALGTAGIQILPIGIHYEDKAALRSRVFINAGKPIDLDAFVCSYAGDGDVGPDDHDAVRALTSKIEEYMRNVAPDFSDWQEARALTQAAEVTLRAESGHYHSPVSIVDRDLFAAEIAVTPSASKEAVLEATEDFQRDLDGVGLSDVALYEKMRTRRFAWFIIRSLLILLVAVPMALIGLWVNMWPLLGIAALNLLPIGPAVKATLKPTGAMLFFVIAWGIALWQAFERSIPAGFITMVALPVSLAALIYASERIIRIWRAGRQWLKRRKVEALAEHVAAKREKVVAAVRNAVPSP